MVVSTGVEIVLGLFANHTFNVPVFLAPGGETASTHTGLKRRVSALPAVFLSQLFQVHLDHTAAFC